MSELLQYKCPNCGGAIEFDSSLQKMKCPYCDAEFDVEALKKYGPCPIHRRSFIGHFMV